MSMKGREETGKQIVNLVLTVLEIVAPVFLLGGIGFAWVRAGVPYPVEFVTRLAMTLAVPALIFTALMGTELAPTALSALSLATLAAYGVLLAIVWGLVMLLRLDPQTFHAPLVFGNTGNIGLPLAYFAFGDQGLSFAVVVFALGSALQFSVGVGLVAGRANPATLLREPMVWASALGALFVWRGWETPRLVTNTLELLAGMAIPLMLITLGVAVGRLKPARLGWAGGLTVLKAALCIGVAWTVGRVFALPPVPFAVLVLQIATPVAVTSYLLAQKYGADAEAVAGLVVTSTVFATLLIPGLLAVMI